MSMDVSLIIPVYNTQAYLPECLASVAAQTVFSRVQVILVDDGSTDGSGQICDDFARQHDGVRVLHVPNGGVSAARNAGIEQAEGDYLAFADSDDTIVPDMLENLLTGAKQSGAEMTFCDMLYRQPGQDVKLSFPFASHTLLGRDFICGTLADFMNADESFNSLCNKLFLRRRIDSVRLRLTDGRKYGEDREFILRFLQQAKSVYYVPVCGYIYRSVDSSAIQKPRTDYVAMLTTQFAQDVELMAALGMDEARFMRTGGICWGAKIAGIFGYVESRMRGRTRRRTMRMLVRDPQLQALLQKVTPAQQRQTRFNRMMLSAVRRRSVFSLRCILRAMRIRVFLYGLLKRGKQDV